MRDGRFPLTTVWKDLHPLAIGGVAPKVALYSPLVSCKSSPGKGKVLPVRAFAKELGTQIPKRSFALAYSYQPAGVFIDPMR